MRGFAFGLALGVVALVGCSKPADNAAASGTMPRRRRRSAPAAAAGPAGPIALAQLPAPTAGQWSRSARQPGRRGGDDGQQVLRMASRSIRRTA